MTPKDTAPSFQPALFQSFEERSDPKNVAPRLKALRAEMTAAGLDGFLIPRADAHRGESVPPGDARLAYVTAFTGSAGLALVGTRKAALFIDSRYTLQAPAQTDTSKVTPIEALQTGIAPHFATFVPKGGRIGYDPWLHTPGEIKDLAEKLAGTATLVATDNLVDRIWKDRPAAPATPVAALQPETVSSPAPVVRRMTAAPRATARLSSAMPESVIATHMSEPPWPDDEQNMTIPTLPALAGPAPITIEPIGWHDLAIAPVTVAAIEVKAIELEPLRTGAGGA